MAGDQASAKRARGADDAAEGSPPKRPCVNYNDLIKVLVGPEEQCFTVHKTAICAKSKFFQAACAGRWREGQEKVVRLPEACSGVFQLYADWAYTDTLTSAVDSEESLSPLIKLHLLGDVLDDIKLRNQAMRDLALKSNVTNTAPSSEMIKLAYGQTTSQSLLRKWIVDDTILTGGRHDFASHLGEYPAEFVQELAMKLMQQTDSQRISSDAFFERTLDYLEKVDI